MKKFVFLAIIIICVMLSPQVLAASSEMRGVWISSVYNLDFPSEPTVSVSKMMSEIDDIIKECAKMGFNAVFLQVRPSSDALYASDYFPWSSYLTGEQGRAPDNDFDPLEYWVEKCHENSMELHAWINPYRITKNGDAEYASLSTDNPAVLHPEWIVKYTDGNYYYDPAIPEVRRLVTDGVRELLENYDIDGIHMDDYFYPGADFDDTARYELYNNGEFSDISDWRRNNVNILVESLHKTVHSVKSDAVFGISPIGIWDNISTNPLGSNTSGKAAYSSQFADSVKWVKEGWVDYLAPQIYWEFGNKAADYETLANWWNDIFENSRAKLYIGLADYRCTDAAENSVWYNGAEIERQIKFNTNLKNVCGEIHFRYKMINENIALKQKLSQMYRHPVIVMIDGKRINFDVSPIIKDDRTLVPMRKIFEEFGFDVDWNDSIKTVTAANGDTVVTMQVENADFYVNDIKFTCDVPPQITNDRTLIPIRALSEALSCDVDWNDDDKTVLITK